MDIANTQIQAEPNITRQHPRTYRWNVVLTASLLMALVTGGFAIVLSALSAANLLEDHRHPDHWVAGLLIAALVFLILVAHSIDRIRERPQS